MIRIGEEKMGIEKAKVILDKALQRCQEYNWKDWSEPAVEELILDVKSALNKYEAPARIETQADRNDEIDILASYEKSRRQLSRE